jgi:hypothetical protein
MSSIRISVAQSADVTKAIRAIRPATGASMSQIKAQVESRKPVYEAEWFMNDFADVANRIRGLIKRLQEFEVPFSIHEGEHLISTEVLFNILAGSEEYGI